MIAYLTETLGTFFLVLVIALTGDPLAIGFTIVTLVYAGATLSGAHYNPAVTIALYLRKKISQRKTIAYIIAQLIGSIAAALMAAIIFREPLAVAPAASVSWLTAMVTEALFTFLLVFVILHVAASKKTQGNQYFGLAIGATVIAGATAAGGVSGGALNPAVGIGPLLANIVVGTQSFDPSLLFLYIIGPITGAIFAALFHDYSSRVQ